jgi:hypothetical protein
MADLRQRLDALKTRARATEPRPTPTTSAASGDLAAVLGGQVAEADGQPYWHIETPFHEICEPRHVTEADVAGGVLVAREDGASALRPAGACMVVDIETGGFAGTPVFLIGVVLLDRQPLTVVQLLARDYPEEEAIVRRLAAYAAARDTWITFNGKSFDAPFLLDRAVLHRVPLVGALHHVDVLHAARRRWRDTLPNCKLGTLETHILERPRVGDVPSADVPLLFHHFVQTGNARPLAGVLEHNRLDLVSSTELLVRLSRIVA